MATRVRVTPLTLLLLVTLAWLGPETVRAEAPPKIRDNLFLVEEAYNQEPGVIQHAQLFQHLPRSGGWSYSFTEEWPAPGDRHQLSVSLAAVRRDAATEPAFGDLLLSYRLQVLGAGGRGRVAVAPRLSLVVPTGDCARGAGRGGLGIQLNLPVSIDLSTHFVLHFNAGATVTPRAVTAAGDRRAAVDSFLGAALVWLPFTWANLLVEAVHQTTASFPATGGRGRDATVIVSPGVRFALDLARELQVVPGLAAPVTVWPRGAGVGVLAYLSVEHRLW
jgi:hypothetical protein